MSDAALSRVKRFRAELAACATPGKAKVLRSFFKTGPGEYGEGDVFLGVMVPSCRAVAKRYAAAMTEAEIGRVLHSKIHEERLVALLMMVARFEKAAEPQRRHIFEWYLGETKYVNNWDLVDLSSRFIVGGHLRDKSRRILHRLAKSADVWERRIAIVSTYAFIQRGDLDETFALAAKLLGDKHDLIHKAVGWMLREAGKKDASRLRSFLDRYAPTMPRTMLRYALEKFGPQERKRYMVMK
ncbi:MAG: DNA alkylation repair protein [Planctomycetota bacterium]|nr:DNA alkylation repair protein [Planctomycetota bacterium]